MRMLAIRHVISAAAGALMLFSIAAVSVADSTSLPEQLSFEQVLWFAQRAHVAYETPRTIRQTYPNTVSYR